MKREKLQQEISKLKTKLAQLEDQLEKTPGFDWDNEDPEVLFKRPDWNRWDTCPVGSLAQEYGITPEDHPVLSQLGFLTDDARNGLWDEYIKTLRAAVRAYIEETR